MREELEGERHFPKKNSVNKDEMRLSFLKDAYEQNRFSKAS